ncbi:PRC-barrel domain-containing protein [Falsirhodobacter algicola]|uniref:PRC-barrel domain-containing protein n=1 Tax=Falsirhodobacter algicola TaxID=2692330 RepID=A0A8J8MUQ8_9RHOB|nr:PRC-barrel domain-containing protein [Falsirhodobacter algicola]QUS36814.1 hypothetical protein GR316_11385 [Falsirhodobacter algicola]
MKNLALSTAILALMSGAALAQTSPDASNPTTATGQEQPPLTGRDASPSDPGTLDTGNEGGEPAMDAQSNDTPMGSEAEQPGTMSDPMPGESDTAPEGMDSTDPGMDAPTPAPGMDDTTAGSDPSMATPEGYAPVDMATLTADQLDGATVYDQNEADVGEISEVMPEEGMPETVIVDVGGFLGLGERSVALNVSELSFYQEVDGDELRAFTMMTEDELKELPEYEE